jgi:hypothetical protein
MAPSPHAPHPTDDVWGCSSMTRRKHPQKEQHFPGCHTALRLLTRGPATVASPRRLDPLSLYFALLNPRGMEKSTPFIHQIAQIGASEPITVGHVEHQAEPLSGW